MITRLVLAFSALYLVAYQYRQGVPHSLTYKTLFASSVALVFLEVAIIVALVVMIVRQRRPERERVEAAGPPTPVPARLDLRSADRQRPGAGGIAPRRLYTTGIKR